MALLPDLQQWLDEAAQRHRVPGAAIAVGVGDELAEAATGVVNRNTGVETTPDSLFQIGSVTKVWTATLIMQLIDEGLVELDKPVRTYLPDFTVIDPDASEHVTIRQLLSHTGGFEGDLFEDTGRGDDAVDRLVAFMRNNATQIHPPGELFSYCNAGYCALGALIAKLRGGTWESVLRKHLIEPLGVTHMALFAEDAVMFRTAVGHYGDPQEPVSLWQLPRSNGPAGATPCAAPRELVRFGRMFLGDGDGRRWLRTMREPQVTLPPAGARSAGRWGLGFALYEWDGVPVVGHDGGTPGQSTCWRIVPDLDVVVAVNMNGGSGGALLDEVLTAVFAEVADIRLPARTVPPATPVAFDAGIYTGRFQGPLAAYEVVDGDGGLDITANPLGLAAELGEEPSTFHYVALGNDRFVATRTNDGVYPEVAFLQNGRYLFNGRALPRR
jgi:CubicO group peptidase (beta-lactamase class C family)